MVVPLRLFPTTNIIFLKFLAVRLGQIAHLKRCPVDPKKHPSKNPAISLRAMFVLYEKTNIIFLKFPAVRLGQI